MQTKSSFQFIEYIIRKSIFLRNPGNTTSEYDIHIFPSGIVNIEKSQFQLSLDVNITNEKEESLINVEIIGLYKFQGALEDVKIFLFLNGPAILYPYLRAYISTLTSLSGLDTFTLPTMNLSNLKDELEANVEIID